MKITRAKNLLKPAPRLKKRQRISESAKPKHQAHAKHLNTGPLAPLGRWLAPSSLGRSLKSSARLPGVGPGLRYGARWVARFANVPVACLHPLLPSGGLFLLSRGWTVLSVFHIFFVSRG